MVVFISEHIALFGAIILASFACVLILLAYRIIRYVILRYRAIVFNDRLVREYLDKGYVLLNRDVYKCTIEFQKSDLYNEALNLTINLQYNTGNAQLILDVTLQLEPPELYTLRMDIQRNDFPSPTLKRAANSRSFATQSEDLYDDPLQIVTPMNIDADAIFRPVPNREPLELIVDVQYTSPGHERLKATIALENSGVNQYPFMIQVFKNPPDSAGAKTAQASPEAAIPPPPDSAGAA